MNQKAGLPSRLSVRDLESLKGRLVVVKSRLHRRLRFVENYAEVYKFSKRAARRSLRRYAKLIQAIDQLLLIEIADTR